MKYLTLISCFLAIVGVITGLLQKNYGQMAWASIAFGHSINQFLAELQIQNLKKLANLS